MQYYSPDNPQLNRLWGPLPSTRQGGLASALMPDGRLLLAGGQRQLSTEFFDPRTGTTEPGLNMTKQRFFAEMAVLNDKM